MKKINTRRRCECLRECLTNIRAACNSLDTMLNDSDQTTSRYDLDMEYARDHLMDADLRVQRALEACSA
tara:strand:- start:33 stop:239 length:207 start_codon:yes stop_codon:yes gene_type:complete